MLDILISYGFYLVTGLLVVGIPLLYILRVTKRKERTRENYERSKRLGLSEPVTLHPIIDPNRCIGTESCVKACPEGEIIGVVDGKTTLVCPTKCIGHGACAAACPVQAITLVFGTETRGVDLPELTPTFETNIKGIYVAGELGGMGLIRNAVTQGWEATNYIGEALPEHGDSMYDIAIVGAGPAGLSASLKAMDMGLSYICLEQEDIGGTILTYPRRKLVMTQPMDIPLYGKVKKREMFKEELLDLWNEIISRTGLSVNTQEKVESITGKAGNFVIRTTRGEYNAQSVLLSIGRRGTPRKLGVTGEKSSKVAYRLIEPEQYRTSKVLIVGGGDSAIEAATSVSEYTQHGVILSYRQDALLRVKEANRELLEAAVTAGRIECLFGSEVREIREKEAVLDVKGKSITMENDYVLVFIGGTLPTPFLQEIGINIRTKFGRA